MDPLSTLFVATSIISLIQMAADAAKAGDYKQAAEIRAEITKLESQASNHEIRKINELDKQLRLFERQRSNLDNTVRGSKADQAKERLERKTVQTVHDSDQAIMKKREETQRKSRALESLARKRENKPTIIQNLFSEVFKNE